MKSNNWPLRIAMIVAILGFIAAIGSLVLYIDMNLKYESMRQSQSDMAYTAMNLTRQTNKLTLDNGELKSQAINLWPKPESVSDLMALISATDNRDMNTCDSWTKLGVHSTGCVYTGPRSSEWQWDTPNWSPDSLDKVQITVYTDGQAVAFDSSVTFPDGTTLTGDKVVWNFYATNVYQYDPTLPWKIWEYIPQLSIAKVVGKPVVYDHHRSN